MIKLENVVLDSLEQMKFIIEGMRNPMLYCTAIKVISDIAYK